jgi:hypothetical protein
MERTEVLDMMGELKLYGMRNAYDEALATAVKRKHEPQHFVGDPSGCVEARAPVSGIQSDLRRRSLTRRPPTDV